MVRGRWSGVGGLGSSGSRGLPGDLRFLVFIYWTTVWVEIAALYHLQTFIGRYLPFSERTISDFTYFRIGISAVNHPRKPEILARSVFLHAKLCKYFRPSEYHTYCTCSTQLKKYFKSADTFFCNCNQPGPILVPF